MFVLYILIAQIKHLQIVLTHENVLSELCTPRCVKLSHVSIYVPSFNSCFYEYCANTRCWQSCGQIKVEHGNLRAALIYPPIRRELLSRTGHGEQAHFQSRFAHPILVGHAVQV